MATQINMDYIGVVKEHSGTYKFEQIPIIKSLEIKEQLRAMCENPNRTLLDQRQQRRLQRASSGSRSNRIPGRSVFLPDRRTSPQYY